jgi:hypothetical protein
VLSGNSHCHDAKFTCPAKNSVFCNGCAAYNNPKLLGRMLYCFRGTNLQHISFDFDNFFPSDSPSQRLDFSIGDICVFSKQLIEDHFSPFQSLPYLDLFLKLSYGQIFSCNIFPSILTSQPTQKKTMLLSLFSPHKLAVTFLKC